MVDSLDFGLSLAGILELERLRFLDEFVLHFSESGIICSSRGSV